jgi:PIN domain nuclease of toxin-antitoxin system
MIVSAIADTHAAIWYLYDDRRLSHKAKAFFEAASKNDEQVGVSSITLAEIVYLVERSRIPLDAFHRLLRVFDSQGSLLVEVPFDRRIAEALAHVARASVPELPDRIVAATALHFGVPVISRDSKIMASGIATIW